LAEYLGLKVTGTLGILVKAKTAGLIPSFRAEAEKMRKQGIFYHLGLIDRLASHIGEI
jgi:predicted nucleic acid-binding protein